MTGELFRSANLLVRHHMVEGADACVVTFDNHGSPAELDEPGFGEGFFVDRGIPVVVVRGRGDHWYQYHDMPAALAAIRGHVARYRRVMTYGSSMGGYAALRFADAIAAHACLALSPQYSLDPAKVPFEHRWSQEAGTVEWRERPIRCSFTPVIAYDSRGPDRRHVELIGAETPVALIPLPYGGHPVGTLLSDIGLLAPLIAAVLDGTIDTAAWHREALARRRRNPIRWCELARRQPPRRRRLAIGLARRALAARPGSDLMMHVLAILLTEAGAHDEALALHRDALALSGGFLGYRWDLSQALELAGDRAAALVEARALADDHPHLASVQHWLGHLLWRVGDRRGAIRHTRLALALAPHEPLYASALRNYLRRDSWRGRFKSWSARMIRRHRR